MKKIVLAVLCSFGLLHAAPSAFNVMKTFVELGVDMGFAEDEISLKELVNAENLDLDDESIATNATLVSVENIKNGFKLNLISDGISATATIDLSDNADILQAVKEMRDEIAADSELTLKSSDISEKDFVELSKKQISELKDGQNVGLICAKASRVDGQVELEDCFLNDVIIDFTTQVLITSLDKKDLEALRAVFKLMVGQENYDKMELSTKEQRRDLIETIMNGDEVEEEIAQ